MTSLGNRAPQPCWRRRQGLLALCAAPFFLTACASRPPALEGAPWVSGRLSVQVAADSSSAARSMSASFDLRGHAEQGELRLTSPLGTLVAAASWAPGYAQLETPQGVTRHRSLEALAQEALGEPLPLYALPDWLQGKPWQGASSQTLANGFEQLDWRVNLARFEEGHIDAERLSPPGVKLRVRLEKP